MPSESAPPPPPAAPLASALAVYPGSFDPITLGHLDVIRRAAALFDEVILGIAHNAAKAGRHLLDIDTRVRLARGAVEGIEGARVEIIPGLLADFCRERGARAIVKGLRNGADLDAEAPMALANRELGGPETVLLIASPAHAHVSSSLVKDIAAHGGDIAPYVPPAVATALCQRLAPLPGPDRPHPGPQTTSPARS